MITFKAERNTIEFTYEFKDGKSASFTYMEPTTAMIDAGMEEVGTKALLSYSRKTLEECLSGDKRALSKLFKEQQEHGNIYKFKRALDEALGN